MPVMGTIITELHTVATHSRNIVTYRSYFTRLGLSTDLIFACRFYYGYYRRSSRSSTVHPKCSRPCSVLGKTEWSHNPIAPWAPLAESSGAYPIPVMCARISLSPWYSAVLPSRVSAPSCRCRRASPPLFRCHLVAARSANSTDDPRRPRFHSG